MLVRPLPHAPILVAHDEQPPPSQWCALERQPLVVRDRATHTLNPIHCCNVSSIAQPAALIAQDRDKRGRKGQIMDYGKAGKSKPAKAAPKHREHNEPGTSKKPFGKTPDKAELLERMKAAAKARAEKQG